MWWLSKSFVFFIFYCYIISSSSSSQSPLCRPETRTALLNLSYSAWDFNKSADCCTWDGVECDSKTGHVTTLLLFPNETITPKSSLFSLIHLQNLAIISYFDIELGSDAFDALTRNLTKLQYLQLFGVDMSSVPPASLMNLSSSIGFLSIDSCELRGELPSNCTLPSNLTTLSLDGNSFNGPIPSWIYSLPNLESLFLSNNNFTGEIGEFQTSSLSEFRVSNNTLQGAIPRSLFHQMELSHLDLSSNNFTGTLQLQELSKLEKLIHLDLSYNHLSVTDNSTNCTFESLIYLYLSYCNLTQFPHFLRSSKELKALDLSNNQINGIVPKWIRELKNLWFLDLRSNFFFGSLPHFPPLSYLFVSRNQFSGDISSSICNLTSLEGLDLSYNNLSRRIPPCIGNSTNLSVLDLRSNKLHGGIPESLFVEGCQLQSLNLNGNMLKGQIPISLVNCTELEILDLGNNEFNDTYPDWIESILKLQVLVLRGNNFHGLIGNPKPIFPFQNLRIMDLSHNHFTGDLPTKYFDNFNAMQMDNRDGKLRYVGEGNIYQSYYQDSVRMTMKGSEIELERIQTIFTIIDFSRNNFSGQIPESLGKLKSLNGLNLSHNMLTGILPPSLGNLSNIEWLDLSSNELVGNIPVELADIPWLSFFNVSHNHLQGPIPQGKQFNTFQNDSFKGNLNLCGFPLSKSCGGDPPEPSLEQGDDDEYESKYWRIVMIGYASGLVIGISIGYMLLYSNGKLHWLSERILEEVEYRRAIKPNKRNGRR